MDDSQIIATVAIILSSLSLLLILTLFLLLIDLRKRLNNEVRRSQLTINPSKEMEHKLQLVTTDLKRMDEKLSHAAELVNRHLKNQTRTSAVKETASETPRGPGTGMSSSTGTTPCETDPNTSVLIDTEPLIFTSVGSDVEPRHCAVNVAEDIFLRAEIGIP